MANVFGILTAIVLALSAFIALKNKKAYEDKIADTQAKKATLVTTEARLAADREMFDITQPAERKDLEDQVATLVSEESALKKTNDGLTAEIETKTAKIAKAKEELDSVRERTSKLGDINQLATKLRTLKTDIADLGQSIDSTTAKLANLTAENTSAESRIVSTQSKFTSFSNGESLPELNTRIRSIYPTWGFVTLAAGNNAGVVANSTLNVVRGGEVIARLLVTGVEGTTAAASIVPDSLAADTTLMVGDRVVPGATKPKKSRAPATGTAPATAPAAGDEPAEPDADEPAAPAAADPFAPAADEPAAPAADEPAAPAADEPAAPAADEPAAPAAADPFAPADGN